MRKLLIFLLPLLLFCHSASAILVQDIIVLNNKRFTDATVLSYMEFEQGDDISTSDINSSIKSLYRTGFFRNITITQDGGRVYVDLQENAFVRRTNIIGSKLVSKDKLEEVLIHKPRSIFSEYKLKREIDLMKQVYQRKGYSAAKIDANFIDNGQHIDIEYHIIEGGAQKIESIKFMGNSKYSDRKLRRVVSSRQKAFWRWLTSSDRYDPDRVEFDAELLKRYYRNKGFIDFEIIDTEIEESESGSVNVIFSIIEGEKHHIGDVAIKSNLDHPLPDLLKFIKLSEGDVYNDTAINNDIEILTDKLGEFGFPFVSIEPEVVKADEAGIVNITYIIQKTPKVYINQIKIQNNTRTLDKVIRREVLLDEGDPYNTSKIKRSIQRVKGLRYFNNVEHRNETTAEHDRVDVIVDVDEASTGELHFGASVSTEEQGVGGFIKLGERNFLGKGLDLNLKLSLAAKHNNISFGISEPYFMGYKFRAGLKLFADEQDQEKQSSYKSRSVGGVISGTYYIADPLVHVLRYSLKESRLRDIPDNASRFIKAQEGSSLSSSIGHSLIWSELDDNIDPTKGYVFSLTQDYAGLGGDVKYFKNVGKAVGYLPVIEEKLFLKGQLSAGIINGHSNTELRINNKFFLGPNDVRGFDISGIGARDIDTGESLGGTKFFTLKTDLIFPLGFGEASSLRGYIFHDMGNLWGGIENDEVFNSNKMRASYGYGVSMDTPLGPLTMDWGYAYSKESFDKTKKFRLSYRTPF